MSTMDNMDNAVQSNLKIQRLVFTGLLAALGGVLMSLEFSIPFFPPFYKVDFSDVPTVIALFSMGPVPALCVEIIKILIKLATVGTNSMYVGEFSNLIGAFLFVLPMWYILRKTGKSRKGMASALTVSAIIRIAFMCFCNACITLPMYAAAMGVSLNDVVLMVSSVNPMIRNLPGFIVLATIPFNIIKLSLNYSIGYLLFGRLAAAMPMFKLEREKAA